MATCLGMTKTRKLSPATPEVLIRRSSRTIVASQMYSLSLHYLLLIDAG